MTLDTAKVRKYLKKFDFEPLFIEELGWDRYAASVEVTTNDEHYQLRGLAEKRGVQVFECQAAATGEMPDFKTQRKIETQLRRSAREHLVIYTDAAKTKQVWKPVDWRGHEFYPGHQSGDSLIDKLQAIQIPLDEEESLDLLGTVHKLRDAFDRDRITKRFYDRFQKEHEAFLTFIAGIQDQGQREWYASLMLNRLMFIYFIQKKGFLDRDTDYLRNRLSAIQSRKGKGRFQTFYRYFLLTLFHQGFSTQPAERELDTDMKALLGEVPYLNGGLFDVHELEQHNPKIDIPDDAFSRIFDFFDQYEWTLDTRPLRNDREINPDVLGYIFEKYINQKEMGAYYTKEDITDYIGRNTIIPYLFDEARKKCVVAFQPGAAVWRLLQELPDRYIYPAVRQGVIDDHGEVIPIPTEIERGVADVSARDGWNRPAAAEYALPTETWREYIARRERCLEIRQRLIGGDISQINDLITYNLDIRRFAEDAILSSEGPELLRAFYQAITGISVLDPTCGSGAFLFAALNILEPLYEACLDRMQTFVVDLDSGSPRHLGEGPGVRAARTSPEKFKDFRAVLKDVAGHPNTTYFILKSIIVRNLYGVDIMEEAVEICKLRLFLKLVSQVENVGQLEPLPDIDFNIRPGNTLVGFATLDDVKRTVLGQLVDNELKAQVDRVVEEAEIVDRAFQKFHEMQTTHGMKAREFAAHKQELRNRLDALSEELDRYLAGEYGVDVDKPKKFQEWQETHQPFHWFAEFYGIMRKGGFDAIIGNPPYVEVPKNICRDILVRSYRSALDHWSRDEDVYTFVVERSLVLLSPASGGLGMILPLSLAFSTKKPFQALRRVVTERPGAWWWSHYDRIPSALFGNEVRTRCTISLYLPSSQNQMALRSTTGLNRWPTERRDVLFQLLNYSRIGSDISDGIPKVGSQLQADGLTSMLALRSPLESNLKHSLPFSLLADTAPDFPQPCVYVGGTAYNWFPVWREIPETTDIRGRPSLPARTAGYQFTNEEEANLIFALLASSLGYWWWAVASDGFNLKKWLVGRFPLSAESISATARKSLTDLGEQLRVELRKHYVFKDNKGRVGNFFLPGCATITETIDGILANSVKGLSEAFFADVRDFNQTFSRADIGDDVDSNADSD